MNDIVNNLQAFHRRLYGQGIVYLSTMAFSLFYHLCDQEAFSGMLPEGLQKTCLVLYVNNEVLQFCDFFSALLSFWVWRSFYIHLYNSIDIFKNGNPLFIFLDYLRGLVCISFRECL